MSTATTAVVEIGDLISSRPDFRGGAPCIAGTGITVMRIAGWYRLGMIAEEISRRFGLTLAQVYAALAYYHANQIAIDAALDAEAAEYDRLRELQKLERLKQDPLPDEAQTLS
ncbi:MAG: DUF433 domain-containing protein [Blastocatellia bacterium]|nr:DUF433 domain-containing protein [Blastocatellia bacterium]